MGYGFNEDKSKYEIDLSDVVRAGFIKEESVTVTVTTSSTGVAAGEADIQAPEGYIPIGVVANTSTSMVIGVSIRNTFPDTTVIVAARSSGSVQTLQIPVSVYYVPSDIVQNA